MLCFLYYRLHPDQVSAATAVVLCVLKIVQDERNPAARPEEQAKTTCTYNGSCSCLIADCSGTVEPTAWAYNLLWIALHDVLWGDKGLHHRLSLDWDTDLWHWSTLCWVALGWAL